MRKKTREALVPRKDTSVKDCLSLLLEWAIVFVIANLWDDFWSLNPWDTPVDKSNNQYKDISLSFGPKR